MTAVRRLALACLVSLLAFSASGAAALLVQEPCSPFEAADADEAACPPTCVTCGCCGQAVEPVIVAVTSSPDCLVSNVLPPLPRLPIADPRDILHVPKLPAA
jgi:hypothetical protein